MMRVGALNGGCGGEGAIGVDGGDSERFGEVTEDEGLNGWYGGGDLGGF